MNGLNFLLVIFMFMNLNEEIDRIKKVMNIIKEDNITLPVIVSGSYKAPKGNCDMLHAFNDTGGKTIGGMNDKVNAELIKIYNQGINPDITDVSVDITKDSTTYTVNWSVTITESTDGRAYVGLYSRGHGGNGSWVFSDVSTTNGHASIPECKKSNYIKKRGTVVHMFLVKDFEYNKDGKLGGCQVNQLFYKYSLKEYVNH